MRVKRHIAHRIREAMTASPPLRESRRPAEAEAFAAALSSDAVNGSPKDTNRVLMMGCFRLAQFARARTINARVVDALHERDLLRRDVSAGHNTPRVKAAFRRFGRKS